MLALGIFLIAVGFADLLRAARDASTGRRRLLVTAVGLAVLLLLLIAAGMEGSEWFGLGLALALGLAAWILGSAAALGAAATTTRTRALAAAYCGLGLGVGVALLGGGLLDLSTDWPAVLYSTPVARWPLIDVVVAVGVVLVEMSTANLVVRLLLDAVGVPATANEKQIKGGRILGPMERLMILGLGVVGEPTAAAVVIAAKGLLRFPELQREVQGRPVDGPSDVTEYFLIGSFASWLLALAGVAALWIT